MGRLRIIKNPEKVLIAMEKSDWKQMKRMADKKKVSLTAYVRGILLKKIAANSKKVL